MQMKLSKPSQKLVDGLDEAAQDIIVSSERGTVAEYRRAEREHQEARKKLIRRIYNLEQKARRAL